MLSSWKAVSSNHPGGALHEMPSRCRPWNTRQPVHRDGTHPACRNRGDAPTRRLERNDIPAYLSPRFRQEPVPVSPRLAVPTSSQLRISPVPERPLPVHVAFYRDKIPGRRAIVRSSGHNEAPGIHRAPPRRGTATEYGEATGMRHSPAQTGRLHLQVPRRRASPLEVPRGVQSRKRFQQRNHPV